MTEPNQDPAADDRPSPEPPGPLVPPPPTAEAGRQYQQLPAYPPPPGTQYGSVQFGGQPGSGPYSAGPYGGGAYGPGPYGPGPYGAGPYGYPQGYYGQQQGTSGLAIASLILGICGFFCVTPFVGIGLGIGALVKINKTGQPGKGMAIAGLILSGLWIALLVLMIATGHFHVDNSGPSDGSGPGSDGTNA